MTDGLHESSDDHASNHKNTSTSEGEETVLLYEIFSLTYIKRAFATIRYRSSDYAPLKAIVPPQSGCLTMCTSTQATL